MPTLIASSLILVTCVQNGKVHLTSPLEMENKAYRHRLPIILERGANFADIIGIYV